jgi:hypothetical protein
MNFKLAHRLALTVMASDGEYALLSHGELERLD